MLATNPAGVSPLLEGAARELDDALGELRELARGLVALGERLPFTVDVDAPEERFPANIEATPYYIATEALTNVAKHARAGRAQVVVIRDSELLRFEITDDGIGRADPAQGSGILGLRDGAEAAGGSMTVISPPGKGTHLQATLPLTPA